MQWLQAGGIDEITVAANAETRALRDAPTEIPDIPGLCLREDQAPRRPAGSVRDATVDTDAETIVVVEGTSVPAADLQGLLACHYGAAADVTVLVHPEPGQAAGSGRYVPGGVYVFDRRAVERVPPRGFHDIKEGLLPRPYRSGEPTAAYTAAESSPQALDGPSDLALNDWALERLAALPPANGYLAHGTALCHESARISPDAVFVGQVLLGPDARVIGDAAIVGPTSIGPGCVVCSGALVSRCAVWRGCTIGEDAVADRCILPNGATLAPREWTLGQVLEPVRRERRTAPAPERRARASFFGFRPDIMLAK